MPVPSVKEINDGEYLPVDDEHRLPHLRPEGRPGRVAAVPGVRGIPEMLSEHLDLLDYRRNVAEIYARVRSRPDEEGWRRWVRDRDDLFAGHPQSAVEDRETFTGLHYYEYDPAWRVIGSFILDPGAEVDVAHSDTGATKFNSIGRIEFTIGGKVMSLGALWLAGYAGGLFVPFRDRTNGKGTYGGGRYLLDTAKGADLGHDGDLIVLDFNFAYHPSCVYSPRWSCPLAPPGNHLDVAVTAGERLV